MTGRIDSYHDNVRLDALALVSTHAGRVLDFGGGIGATAAALKHAGRAVHVVVADHVEDSLPEIDKVLRGDLEQSAFIDTIIQAGPFDTILCLDILEHLRDPWMIVRNLTNALAVGGAIIVSVPNVNNRGILLPLLVRGKWELTDQGLLDRTHLRWFTKESLISMLDQPGLTVERVEPTMIRRDRWISRLSMGLLERFFAVQYIVRAVKR
jgi:2-polyprenyl-3-methyl-5-hydroxy-6-metoxy-1,4-benzoquinol methylase